MVGHCRNEMNKIIFAVSVFALFAAAAFAAITVDLSSNPIKVTGTASTSETVATGQVGITKIYWAQPTTQGHLLSITNSFGKQIIVVYARPPIRILTSISTVPWW